jgi:hypothetical protein
LGKTIGSAPVPTFRLEALANANDPETAEESQSNPDPSPKVNFARLFCEIDGFRFGFENGWGFDSGMDEGGRSESTFGDGGFENGWEIDSGMDDGGRSESTFGDGELGGCCRARSGGDIDESVVDELDGRGGNEGELSEEDGVRSDGELDRGEFSEDGVRGGGDLEGSGGDGSGAISGTVGFNSESVLRCV